MPLSSTADLNVVAIQLDKVSLQGAPTNFSPLDVITQLIKFCINIITVINKHIRRIINNFYLKTC